MRVSAGTHGWEGGKGYLSYEGLRCGGNQGCSCAQTTQPFHMRGERATEVPVLSAHYLR